MLSRQKLFLLLLLTSLGSLAVDELTLSLQQIKAQGWWLQGIHFKFSGLNQASHNWQATIEQLHLPEPLDQISFVQLRCAKFIWQKPLLECHQGVAVLKSDWLSDTTIAFSFQIDELHSRLTVKELPFAGGSLDLQLELNNQQWLLDVQLNNVVLQNAAAILKTSDYSIDSGRVDAQLQLTGQDKVVQTLQLKLDTSAVSFSNQAGSIAGENMALQLLLNAHYEQGLWFWEKHLSMPAGAVYIAPVYIESPAPNKAALTLSSAGSYEQNSQQIQLRQIDYQHPKVMQLSAQGDVFDNVTGLLNDAEIAINIDDMQMLSEHYLAPYFEATVLQGVTFSGQMQAKIHVVKQQLRQLKMQLEQFDMMDDANRILLTGGQGQIHWSDDLAQHSLSEISWQGLQIAGIPIDQASLQLETDATRIALSKAVDLSVLDGVLHIEQFDFQTLQHNEPDVQIVGHVQNVSLEELTTALDILPLSGTITGNIPGVHLQQGTLSLDGELKIQVFDGEITVTKLASSGLLSALPRFYADVEIDNLDLNQLTRKFSFGFIEGRLSGFIRDLYLENWQAVSFYAWLGTPDNDDSRHRISQKAVQNIASIGGGGAADLVSRGFLGFFETFRYDKLGLGCYLHKGVCQLMGVRAVKQGYYIVEGGGLPRIDVIGYNPRVDWHVLLQRLQRLTQTDDVVIE